MSIDDDIALLSRLELFEHLNPIKLKRLIFVSKRYQLQANEYLFKQGDPMDSVFGVVHGKLSVVLETDNGEVVAARQGPGDLVGEMAIISGKQRSASIRADSECEVIGFEKDLFINTVINDPPTALKMMKLLSDRLTRQNSTLAKISEAQYVL